MSISVEDIESWKEEVRRLREEIEANEADIRTYLRLIAKHEREDL